MSQHILLNENKIFLSMFNKVKRNVKRLFLIKSIKCDMSNFSEFHQDYESAGLILFSGSWIFANFVTEQPAVMSTTS